MQQVDFQATNIKRAAATTHADWPEVQTVLLHTVSLQQSARLPFEGAEEGGRNVEGPRPTAAPGGRTQHKSIPHGKRTGSSSNTRIMQRLQRRRYGHATRALLLFSSFFLLQVDLNFVRKGRRTTEGLLHEAFNTANKTERQQLDCTEDIDTFWLDPFFFLF